MFDKADLVVIAKPVTTNDTSERTTLPGDLQVTGVNTKFDVLLVLKGGKLKDFVLHHYRLSNEREAILNGPVLVRFQATQGPPYLLFLSKEADGRYAPTTDQIDPGASSVIELHGASR
jgi:hypothetical protein